MLMNQQYASFKGGLTYQRLKVIAVVQDAFLQQQFISEVTVYAPEMFVFIDETSTKATKNLLMHCTGRTSVCHCLLINGRIAICKKKT